MVPRNKVETQYITLMSEANKGNDIDRYSIGKAFKKHFEQNVSSGLF